MTAHATGEPLTYATLVARLTAEDATEPAVREGQFHRVVIGARRVLCFPRTPAAAARLPARAATLRAVGRAGLPFDVPSPLPTGGGPVRLELTRIPGAPLDPSALTRPEVAEAAARGFATLLTALVRAGGQPGPRAELPETPRDEWRRFASDVRAELFPLLSTAGRARAERELAAVEALPYVSGALVHGDLGGENVLWETEDGLPVPRGVVDWDEAAIGDPAVDLAAVAASYGDAFLRSVVAHGGPVLRGPADRVAAIRGTFALQQALSALRDGDTAELADGLRGYGRV
ncbi:aminoglycoside phosphotransferase family protein [Streptomyces sp. URMC 126]|uniref:aminoglycoside phosphotransferase family protein n=1 Tax=Streptomyces sp. URMC 126 TaxID=3423401 RepID=UPI003F1CB7A4